MKGTQKSGGINLLPEALRVPGRLQILSRFLRQGSFIVVGIYIFILLLLLVTSFLFSRQEGALQAKNATLAGKIENLRNREGLLAVLKNRARVAGIVFTKAPNVRDNIIDDIINTFSSGTQVSEVVSESGQTNVTAVAPTLGEVKEIFVNLQSLDSSQITLTTLSLEPSGGYSFSLEVK